MYTQWIGLFLSFHLNWILGSFVHGQLHNLKTSEDTFGHGLTPSMRMIRLAATHFVI